jgi:hypothetical protein
VDYAFSGRYERRIAGTWNQFEDFTGRPEDNFGMLLGVAAFYTAGEWGESAFDAFLGDRKDESSFVGLTADLTMEWGGASLYAAATWEYLDTGPVPRTETNAYAYGYVIQGGVYVSPKCELFGRFEYGSWEPDRPFDEFPTVSAGNLSVLTLGLNYYLDGHDIKFTTDFGFTFQPISVFYGDDLPGYRAQVEDSTQMVLRTQVQLLF